MNLTTSNTPIPTNLADRADAIVEALGNGAPGSLLVFGIITFLLTIAGSWLIYSHVTPHRL